MGREAESTLAFSEHQLGPLQKESKCPEECGVRPRRAIPTIVPSNLSLCMVIPKDQSRS